MFKFRVAGCFPRPPCVPPWERGTRNSRNRYTKFKHALVFNIANLLNTLEKDSTWRLISGPAGIKIPISKRVAPYAMTKAAVLSMTRSMAMEWADKGVRVNTIAPGFILTDLSRKLWSRPDMRAWAEANTPQGRLGEVDDLVGTAIFLSSRASAFMTGQVLRVDGGFTAGVMWPIDDQ